MLSKSINYINVSFALYARASGGRTRAAPMDNTKKRKSQTLAIHFAKGAKCLSLHTSTHLKLTYRGLTDRAHTTHPNSVKRLTFVSVFPYIESIKCNMFPIRGDFFQFHHLRKSESRCLVGPGTGNFRPIHPIDRQNVWLSRGSLSFYCLLLLCRDPPRLYERIRKAEHIRKLHSNENDILSFRHSSMCA